MPKRACAGEWRGGRGRLAAARHVLRQPAVPLAERAVQDFRVTPRGRRRRRRGRARATRWAWWCSWRPTRRVARRASRSASDARRQARLPGVAAVFTRFPPSRGWRRRCSWARQLQPAGALHARGEAEAAFVLGVSSNFPFELDACPGREPRPSPPPARPPRRRRSPTAAPGAADPVARRYGAPLGEQGGEAEVGAWLESQAGCTWTSSTSTPTSRRRLPTAARGRRVAAAGRARRHRGRVRRDGGGGPRRSPSARALGPWRRARRASGGSEGARALGAGSSMRAPRLAPVLSRATPTLTARTPTQARCSCRRAPSPRALLRPRRPREARCSPSASGGTTVGSCAHRHRALRRLAAAADGRAGGGGGACTAAAPTARSSRPLSRGIRQAPLSYAALPPAASWSCSSTSPAESRRRSTSMPPPRRRRRRRRRRRARPTTAPSSAAAPRRLPAARRRRRLHAARRGGRACART